MDELRVKLPADTLAVIDGYCSAMGKCRTEHVQELLSKWAADQLRVSTIVCRVAGVNPMVVDRERKDR